MMYSIATPLTSFAVNKYIILRVSKYFNIFIKDSGDVPKLSHCRLGQFRYVPTVRGLFVGFFYI